jgi:acetyl esterase/lipase
LPIDWENKMRRSWLILASAPVLLGLASSVAVMRTTAADTPPAAPAKPPAKRFGTWQLPPGRAEIPIWPNGAPDMADWPEAAEKVEITDTTEALNSRTDVAIYDVSAPTMTVFPPRGRNTGAAMIVFPGGGFQVLVMTLEGTEICDWLTARGITCILSKYRVPGSEHYWNRKCDCTITPKVPRALQDAQRTIRLVRSRSKELMVDPDKIGVIGFSAGGYMVVKASNVFEPAYKPVDAVDRISSRPDFAVALYPGHLCRQGNTLDPAIHVTDKTPPTFLLQAWDDPVDDVCNSTLYARALDDAGVPSEVHLFAKGGHAFALRRKQHPVAMWPSLVESWLKEIGVLHG